MKIPFLVLIFGIAGLLSCNNMKKTVVGSVPVMKKPLVTRIYTADPSAHVFEGTLFIYPSHDLSASGSPSNEGNQYGMRDYHVFSLESMQSPVIDHGEVLHLKDIPWASKQLWAPDAACKNGIYYLYFPARDKAGVFRIGVAASLKPEGPFAAQPEPIPGSFSIDPALFTDDDGQAYLYFGGIWGGQLEKWRSGSFNPDGEAPLFGEPAIGPRVAKMADDMLTFDGGVREIAILDEKGNPLIAGDHDRRFFEAAWVHKYRGVYYLSYSTGDTHFLVYATGKTPTGPFTYQGRILNPVRGWTTHHSIVEFQGKWYLFYHDSSLSGEDNKRCMKFTELHYNPDGTIQTIDP